MCFLYFGATIFKSLSASTGVDAGLLQQAIISGSGVLFTLVAIATVDRWGRKPLMLLGTAGMGLSLVAMGIMAQTMTDPSAASGWMLFFIVLYIACFGLSVGPVVWVILSEIFPTAVRGRALGLATFFLWMADYAVTQTFPIMDAKGSWFVRHFNHAFPFYVYAGFCVALILLVWLAVPETKGRSLEEIERSWARRHGKLTPQTDPMTDLKSTSMNSRQRLQATLEHRQPDRVCVDFGATFVTGIHVSIVHRLRQRVLGETDYRVKVIEPYQMLGEVDDQLRAALGHRRGRASWGANPFSAQSKRTGNPSPCPTARPCLVPGTFNVTPAPDGGWLMYPEGDTSAAAERPHACGRLLLRLDRPPGTDRRGQARPGGQPGGIRAARTRPTWHSTGSGSAGSKTGRSAGPS